MKVVTTNIEAIAEGALINSGYRFLYFGGEDVVIGNRLEENGRVERSLGPRLVGTPVFGEEKANKGNGFAAESERVFGFALGDSPSNDGPMLVEALRNGGLAFVVGSDVETIYGEFNQVFAEVIGEKDDVAERILCIEHKNGEVGA